MALSADAAEEGPEDADDAADVADPVPGTDPPDFVDVALSPDFEPVVDEPPDEEEADADEAGPALPLAVEPAGFCGAAPGADAGFADDDAPGVADAGFAPDVADFGSVGFASPGFASDAFASSGLAVAAPGPDPCPALAGFCAPVLAPGTSLASRSMVTGLRPEPDVGPDDDPCPGFGEVFAESLFWSGFLLSAAMTVLSPAGRVPGVFPDTCGPRWNRFLP
ncbi:hypothetical protein [Stappia sp. ES.058]|uniref:hypothetical protein n=1 Tax=Stappia sp. ES.058 TaxID=1881061 RepID=UPI0012FD40B7|nr:hypothetical protein [Stappia sp. ES.058]